ncbi:MAG: insulinase family protein [Prevotellaceae bacterium]|jgi:predicted Zn-dependent peptidase|nr:insulinase family protein [Prevotellaceae bacterium]
MVNTEFLTLANGIRLVHRRVKSAVAYCGLTINAGTRDELDHEHGMAHFLEHVLFKGTKNRSSIQISSFLENEGGDLNAFTTKEETVIHAAILKSNIGRAFDIISDIVFNPLFPESGLRKEKEIVRDEINLYKDSPSEQIFDDFEDLVFPNSSLGRGILGTPASLRSFTSQKVLDFVHRCYSTNQMALSSVSSHSIDQIAVLAEKYFSHRRTSRHVVKRQKPEPYSVFKKKKKLSTYQVHCLLGNRTFGYNDDRRYALNLLTNMLGGPSQNSRLSLALRETHGLSYGVDASTTLYSDCGATNIYFGTDKKSVDKCLTLVHDELSRMCESKLSAAELSKAKKQLIGQLTIASESNEQIMLALGKTMLAYNKVELPKEVEEQVKSVTAEQIMDAARVVFDPKKLSSLIYT